MYLISSLLRGKAKHRKKPGLPGRTLRSEALEERIALTVPAGFAEATVAGGLSMPTSMAVAPDGRIFVTEQTGAVRVIKNGALQSTPFLTLNVDPSGERGLLGLAFDPNSASNQFVYVYYTTNTAPIHNRVSRFTANGDVAVAGSEFVLMDLNNLTTASNHNGGALHFGLDGKLYIAVGENATRSNSQTLSNLLGKMLRINSDGTIPSDNPFFNSATGQNRAIWALGLRNPFTFAIQPGSGRIFINDVGEASFEEINDGRAGANYGWPDTEGFTTDPRFVSPLFAYGRTEGRAIAGGAFYNPSVHQFPSAFTGDYFFGDLTSGTIRRFDPDTNTSHSFATALGFGTVDVDVDLNGSLLYLTRGTNSVRRISFTPSGPPLLVAPGPGFEPRVRVLDAATGAELYDFLAYNASFRGGVHVATGDVNMDGVTDIITAPGRGMGPQIKVFDGVTRQQIRDFFAYSPAFTGGAFVASADFDGDGRDDILTGAGPGGGPQVRVFSGLTSARLGSFFAYPNSFNGGVHVAAGNVDGLGAPEIITGPGRGNVGPLVKVFANPAGQEHAMGSRFVYSASFTGGVNVAAGDIDADEEDEIFTGAGPGGGPHVRIFDQSWNRVAQLFAYDTRFTGGVFVGAIDFNNDGRMELITGAGTGGGPHVRIINVATLTDLASYNAYDRSMTGGVFVAAGPRSTGSSGSLVAGSPSAALLAPAGDDGTSSVDEAFSRLADEAEGPLADQIACDLCEQLLA